MTSRASGGPVAGITVEAMLGHEPMGSTTTDADGRYTVSVARSSTYYDVLVAATPETGYGPTFYPGVPCQFATTWINVSRHVGGIDFILDPGHWLAVGIRGASEARGEMALAVAVTPAWYVAARDYWCFSEANGGRSEGEGLDGAVRRWYAAGRYRIVFEPFQIGVDHIHPNIWYPSAPTVNSAKDVVLDRDLVGADTLWIDYRAGYSISGRVVSSDLYHTPLVQVVTLDAGKVGVVAEGYLDFATGAYSFVVPPGSYKVRNGFDTPYLRQEDVYHGGARTFDAATTIVVTNANVTGIDIIR